MSSLHRFISSDSFKLTAYINSDMLSELSQFSITDLSLLDLIRVAVLTIAFIYASKLDIKTREINGVIWQGLIVFGLFAIGIDLYNTALPVEYGIKVIANIFAATLFALILERTNLFGLADVKAVIALGITLPTFPNLSILPLYTPQFIPPLDAVFPLVIFTIIVNTTIFLPFVILKLIYTNYRAGDISEGKYGVWVYAYKVPINELEETFGTVIAPWMIDPTIESSEPRGYTDSYKLSTTGLDTKFIMDFLNWKRDQSDNPDLQLSDIESPNQIEYFLKDEQTDWESQPEDSTIDSIKSQFDDEDDAPESDIEADIQRFSRLLGEDEVWVSPGLPFLVPITIGLLTTFTLGDILFAILFF